MFYVGYFLQLLTLIYTFVLLARVALSWIEFFNPQWRPQGIVLVLANLIWTLTEPPLAFLRRYIPPLRLGAVSLDVGFIVLFVGVSMVGRFATLLM